MQRNKCCDSTSEKEVLVVLKHMHMEWSVQGLVLLCSKTSRVVVVVTHSFIHVINLYKNLWLCRQPLLLHLHFPIIFFVLPTVLLPNDESLSLFVFPHIPSPSSNRDCFHALLNTFNSALFWDTRAPFLSSHVLCHQYKYKYVRKWYS